jgi:hypothetical protein
VKLGPVLRPGDELGKLDGVAGHLGDTAGAFDSSGICSDAGQPVPLSCVQASLTLFALALFPLCLGFRHAKRRQSVRATGEGNRGGQPCAKGVRGPHFGCGVQAR